MEAPSTQDKEKDNSNPDLQPHVQLESVESHPDDLDKVYYWSPDVLDDWDLASQLVETDFDALDDETFKRHGIIKYRQQNKKKIKEWFENKFLNKPEPEHQFSLRELTVFEILSTEQSYVSSLEFLISEFVTPCSNDESIPVEAISFMFSELKSILNLNTQLLALLRERITEVGFDDTYTTIADIFLTMGPYFRSYRQYCSNYDAIVARSREIQGSNIKYKKLLESFYINPENKGLSLDMYLIMPVQRIPRYIMLLDTLLKYTDDDHPDYKNICNATVLLKDVSKFVDTSVQDLEDRFKVMDMNKRFIMGKNLVAPHRVFVKEGILVKRSLTDESLQRRHVYLFSDVFITATLLIGGKQKQDKIIPLVTAWVVDKPDAHYSNSFYLASSVKCHIFICRSPEEKQQWMSKIEDTILNLINGNSLHEERRNQCEIQIDDYGHPCVYDPENTENNELHKRRPSKLKNFFANTIETVRGGRVTPRDLISEYSSESEYEDETKRIHIPKKFENKVGQVSGEKIVKLSVKNDHYPIESQYIVFVPSYWLFGYSIGYICIANRGEDDLVLASRRRIAEDPTEEATYSTIPPNQKAYYDYRGNWCIEIVDGNVDDVAILDFSIFGGKGNFTRLNMV
eukprot:TRINITY_DN6245_c0_g1_i1.p1 TRINITY_DN6245_c0_g1~~TRINITY_DN6245_c0_g1_i1.p1  ORF type:complete len:628 (-),score=130.52 TRINITY_DN6245_c0_g1_i1:87-1970(-)